MSIVSLEEDGWYVRSVRFGTPFFREDEFDSSISSASTG
jgi:hypothetical protein